MAKQLLLSTLVDHLGQYVEGLSESNMKLGVWSGKIELKNLKLKPGVLDDLNLPVVVKHGSLKSLRLKIPWASLDSKPVKVFMDGLYIIAAPLDITKMSQDQVKKNAALDKRNKLEKAELKILKAGMDLNQKGPSRSSSYVQHLVAKIVDNLEIVIANIHIRYEDSLTIRGVTFSAGITLDTISLSTTDSLWNEMFVSRDKSNIANVIHKVGRISNLGVYWNTKSRESTQLSPEAKEAWLENLIYTNETIQTNTVSSSSLSSTTAIGKINNGLVYVLSPPNGIVVKIAHNDRPSESSPVVDMIVEMPTFIFNFDRLQYQQLMSLTCGFAKLERQKQMALYRPQHRPTHDPKAWWKYAFVLVTGKEFDHVNHYQMLVKGLKYKRKYIALIKSLRKLKSNQENPTSSASNSSSSTTGSSSGASAGSSGSNANKPVSVEATIQAIIEDMEMIEDILPLNTLLRYRQVAALEMCSEAMITKKDVYRINMNMSHVVVPLAEDMHEGFNNMVSFLTGGKLRRGRKSTPSTGSTSSSSPHSTTETRKKLNSLDDETSYDDLSKEIPLENIVDHFEEEMVKTEQYIAHHDITIVQVNFTGDTIVHLTSEKQPLATLNVAVKALIEAKANSSIISFSVNDFTLIDEYTKNAISPFLIAARSVVERPYSSFPSTSRSRVDLLEDSDTTAINSLTLSPKSGKVSVKESNMTPHKRFNLRPQLSVVVQIQSSGALNLQLVLAPVDMVWNVKCVEKLLAFFLASTDVDTLMYDPLLMVSMNKFATHTALSQVTMTMQIEIGAPKIILPENSSDPSKGGIVLDTGVLSLQGQISPLGMSINLSLNAIHLAMPSDLSQFSPNSAVSTPSSRHDIMYLVKPFSFHLAVQNLDKSVADMTISVTLTDILADLDASKLIRLLRMINIVIQSFVAANEEARLNILSMSGAVAKDLIETMQDTHYFDDDYYNESVMNERDVDILTGTAKSPTVIITGILVTLPSVCISLQVNATHKIQFVASSLEVIVQQRVHDMQVEISLRSISIDDNFRSLTQRYLIWTYEDQKPDDVSSSSSLANLLASNSSLDKVTIDKSLFMEPKQILPLMHLSYRGIYTKQSPYYQGYATEIKGDFTTLNISIDDAAILRLIPFVNELMMGFKQLNEEAIQMSEMTLLEISKQAAYLKSALSKPNTTTVKQRVKGTYVQLEMNSVALQLMRKSPRLRQQQQSPIKSSGNHFTPLKVKVTEEQELLEVAFQAKLIGLSTSFKLSEGTEVKLSLINFTIIDSRDASTKYIHHELVSRSTIATEFLSSRNTMKSKPSVKDFMKADKSHLLTLSFTEDIHAVQTIDINLNDITSMVYLDSIFELVQTVTQMTDSLAELSELLKDDTESDIVSTAYEPFSPQNLHHTPKKPSDMRSVATQAKSTLRATRDTHTTAYTSVAPPQTSCLILRLAVNNPRVIFLENPELKDSKAIVCPFDILVTYSRDVQNVITKEIREITQISLHSTEVFVLIKGLTHGKPQQLIEPTGLELHISRRFEQDYLLQCSIHCDSRAISGKVSLNDLKLMKKILDRTKLVAQESYEKRSKGSTSPMKSKKLSNRNMMPRSPRLDIDSKSEVDSAKPDRAIYDMTAHFGSISLVAINDYFGQSLPVLRLIVDDLECQGSGVLSIGSLNLSGSFIIGLDYFNAPLTVWEPVLERCRPEIQINSTSYQNMSAEVIYDEGTIQFTVSGTFIREAFKSVQLLTRISKGEEVDIREEQHPLMFVNALGVPINLYEGTNKRHVLSLETDQPSKFPIEMFTSASSSRLANIHTQLPTSYDVQVLGPFENERLPLLNLPLNVNKPKSYYLHPINTSRSLNVISTEPIVEEIFENERYSPLTGTWENPWSNMGDPPRWSNRYGQQVLSPSEFLISDRWQWMEGKWLIDKSTLMSKEVDEEGWQYNTSFPAIINSTFKRSFQPMDSVRRRRWTRTRILKSSRTKEEYVSRPLIIFWDPDVNRSNGSRIIRIRSGLQIKNKLGYPISILLSGVVTTDSVKLDEENKYADDTIEFGPILCGEKFCIPLIYSNATAIRVKPSHLPYDWSAEYDCRIQAGGKTTQSDTAAIIHDLTCYGDTHDSSSSELSIQMLFKFSDKGLFMVCTPYAIIYNHLPCTLRYRCTYGSTIASTGQQGTLPAGENEKFSNLDIKKNPKISLCVGEKFQWSRPVMFTNTGKRKYTSKTVDMASVLEHYESMNVTVISRYTEDEYNSPLLEIYIFSCFMFINRSDLTLMIRSKRYLDSDAPISPHILIDEHGLSVVERRAYGSGGNVRNAEVSWTEGNSNVVLFQSDDRLVEVGLYNGSSWSGSISLPNINTSKIRFDILDPRNGLSYQLAYSLISLPGPFQLTKAFTVMSAYTIVNTLPELIQMQQIGLDASTASVGITQIDTMCSHSWHKVDSTNDTRVRLKAVSTDWSIGSVDLNEVGTTVLVLPRQQTAYSTVTNQNSLIVAHIEVKLSEPSENSFLTIVIWAAENEDAENSEVITAALSLQNMTDYPITLLQHNVNYPMFEYHTQRFEICVQPHDWHSFGWVDPMCGTVIRVSVGDVPESTTMSNYHALIDLSAVGSKYEVQTLDFSSQYSAIEFTVLASSCGKIIRAVGKSKKVLGNYDGPENTMSSLSHSSADIIRQQSDGLISDLKLNRYSLLLHVNSIGVSLIADRPYRREFMSLYIEGLEFRIAQECLQGNTGNTKKTSEFDGTTTYFNIRITDAQIDNYSETNIYPVLFHTLTEKAKKKIAKKARQDALRKKNTSSNNLSNTTAASTSPTDDLSDDVSFFLFSAVKITPFGSTSAIYEYIAVRILECRVAIDTATIQLYFIDLHSDLILPSVDQTLAQETPSQWMKEFNERTVIPENMITTVDIKNSKMYAQANKLYIENLILHPIKIRISYHHTEFPRDKNEDILSSPQYLWLKIIGNMVTIDDVQIKLNSFLVSGAMESSASMTKRLLELYKNDIRDHLVQIAGKYFGNLKIVGRPVGLFKNIGGGVKDFFYEPYLGLMHSPEGFMKGVGVGTRSLIKNVAGGALTSGIGVVESVTRNIATAGTMLTGDEDFSKAMNEKRRMNTASTGGAVSGFRAGGESVLSGLTSGLSGLITKPIEEGKKAGALGFVKGLGLGAIGVVVKPVLGVSDGIANVAHGLSNQINELYSTTVARPARAFERSPIDFYERIVVPLEISACIAQQFVIKQAKKEEYTGDKYVASIIVMKTKAASRSVSSSSTNIPPNSMKSNPNTPMDSVKLTPEIISTKDKMVILSEMNIFYTYIDIKLEKAYLDWAYSYSEISHCILHRDIPVVDLVLYKNESVRGIIPIYCDSYTVSWRLYTALWKVNFKMGSAGNMISPEILSSSSPIPGGISFPGSIVSPEVNISVGDTEIALRPQTYTEAKYKHLLSLDHSRVYGTDILYDTFNAVDHPLATSSIIRPSADTNEYDLQIGFEEYQFGTANTIKYPKLQLPENILLQRNINNIQKMEDTKTNTVYDLLKIMDEKLWKLVSEWYNNHEGITASRCCAVLIINRSDSPIQILKCEVLEGRNVHLIHVGASAGYDTESRTLFPRGGACTLFSYGYVPNVFDLAHVKVEVVTSVFKGVFSTRKDLTNASVDGGHQISFLEKSNNEWWAKYVVLIT